VKAASPWADVIKNAHAWEPHIHAFVAFANPPLACALAVMMHALFGVSLGLGFSIFFSCARCMMRELIIDVGRVVRWRVTRLAPCYLSIRNPHAH